MTGGYIMKEKNIQELAIRMGLISVEDMCQYTIAQLVVKIANKVNELVGEVWRFETDVQEVLKTQNENIQYLLGEGLHLEVENIFDGWVQDGTFDTLLNQSALKEVKDRIDETNAQLSEKMDKYTTDISVLQINKNKGLLDETYFTDEFKAQFVENTQPLHTTPADKSITQEKMSIPYAEGELGKNLFNKYTVEKDMFVNMNNGLIQELSTCSASSYIDVIPNSKMVISGSREQLAFYDKNKSFITGLQTGINGFTVPSNAHYIRITCLTSELDNVQLEYGTDSTEYEEFHYRIKAKMFDKEVINHLTNEIAQTSCEKNLLVKGVASYNLFDKNRVTLNKFINMNNGLAQDMVGMIASDYIEVEPNQSYINVGTNEQLAFYGDSKKFISGLVSGMNGYTTPENAKFVRITTKASELNNVMVLKGVEQKPYESYGVKMESSCLSNDNIEMIKRKIGLSVGNEIIVKKDGTGDFNNPVDATNSITDSSENNVYNVYIYEGEYDIIECLGGSKFLNTITESSGERSGWLIPDYVNLIGVGNVTLKGEIPDNIATRLHSTKISTINCHFNSELHNLTVTAKNLRYAIHDERNGRIDKKIKRVVKNCKIEHFGNKGGLWASPSAYGGGSGSHGEYLFENTTFKSPFLPLGFHTNTGFKSPDIFKFVNCRFINTDIFTSKVALRFGGMSSGQKNMVELNGCVLNGPLQIKEEQTGKINDFYVVGHGNSKVPYIHPSDDSNIVRHIFSDEVCYAKNGSGEKIQKGTPVKIIDGYMYTIGNNEEYMYSGVVWNDVEDDEIGMVKFDGYLALSDTSLGSLSKGDIIYLSNGVLTKDKTNYMIGYATSSKDIRLK